MRGTRTRGCEEETMPHLLIFMRQGRTVEQKRQMVKGLTEVLVRTIAAKPEQVSIVINELPDQNLASEGLLLADKP
jgi:4-oxalocrotonate tautomerase